MECAGRQKGIMLKGQPGKTSSVGRRVIVVGFRASARDCCENAKKSNVYSLELGQ